MGTGPEDDTRRQPWVGRAAARPPVDPWPTAEQPIVPPHFAPPPEVVYVPVAVPRRRRGCLFVLGLLVAFVAGGATLALIASPALRGVLGMVDPSPSVPQPSPSPSPTPSPTPPPPPGIGDPVQDGKFEFVVLDLTCDVEEVAWTLLTERPDGQYCVVNLSVQNKDPGNVAIFPGAGQYVVTADDTKVRSASDAGFLANEGHLDVWFIDPAEIVTLKLVFDIPVDAAVSTIELHDSLFSGGVTVTAA